MNDIQTLMRSANPIEDAQTEFSQDEVDALLLLTQQRSGDMDTKQTLVPVKQPERQTRNGWLVAAATFAVVLVVIGSVWLLSRDSETDVPPATTPPTTQAAPPTTEAQALPTTTAAPVEQPVSEVVTTTVVEPDAQALAFVEALVTDINAGEYVSAGERIGVVPEIRKNGYVPGVENVNWTGFFQDMFEYWTLVDSQLSIDECQTSATSGITRCTLTRTSTESFPRMDEELTVLTRLEDGQPVYYEQGPDVLGQYWTDALAFDSWLFETTKADLPAVYAAWFAYGSPKDRAAVEREYGPVWVDAGRP
ncbi:MAG: hypothetical protein ACR2NG_06495 [Acidimicrobiia bacterium]